MDFSQFLEKVGTKRRDLQGKVISYIDLDDRLISLFPCYFCKDNGEIRSVYCEDTEGEGKGRNNYA
jgi:hypothetical protein